MGWAKPCFRGKRVGFVGFYYCGCVFTSLIFHWEATEPEQASCPCLSCSPVHWGHLTWALPPPLHIPVGKKVTPRCHVRDTAQPARLAGEEPRMSLRWFPKGLIFVCSFSSVYQLESFQKCSCYTRMDSSLSETHALLLQLDFFSAALGEVVQLLVLSIIHELLYSGLRLLLPGGNCSSAAFSHFCITVLVK